MERTGGDDGGAAAPRPAEERAGKADDGAAAARQRTGTDDPGAAAPAEARPPGEPDLPGPFPVGRYAARLKEWLGERARVLLIGEVTGFKVTRAQVYFDLRDAEGAVPVSMWRNEFERLGLAPDAVRDGVEVVVGGGPDYYPGSAQASPRFSIRATYLRPAGEGDLLARLAALRAQLEAEGVFEPQKELERPVLPRTIGVVTAEGGAARQDLLAGLERRGWRGRIVWGFAPVQDRRAAPAITAALTALAGIEEVEVIVVCRGGGSLADLWAFCDETLCRTVSMLRVPVVSAVGHERDSTLIDDVAAVACSTPTHAAEAAVPLDCAAARLGLRSAAGALRRGAADAVGARARHLAALARGPERALRRERAGLNQRIREVRAAAERGLRERRAEQRRIALVVLRRAGGRALGQAASERSAAARRAAWIRRSALSGARRRHQALEGMRVALRAHDPERTLERGFALAEGPDGHPVSGAEEARAARRLVLRFADGRVAVRVEEE
ncbi:MAG: exodeoxyribonuclease VII large subunit [Solirubrobacterales bacterium]